MRSRTLGIATVVFLVAGLFAREASALDMGAIPSGETRHEVIALGDFHDWDLSGQAGDRVVIKAVNNNGVPMGMTLELFLGGTPVADNFATCTSLDLQLPGPGPYSVRVSNGCDTSYAGPYDFTFLNATAGPLTFPGDPEGGAVFAAQPAPGTLPLSDADAYQFQGQPGDAVSITVTADPTLTPMIALYRPDGSEVGATCGSQLDVVLDYPGQHTVVLEDCSPGAVGGFGAYELTVDYPAEMGTLNSGETRTELIGAGGVHRWRFFGRAGDVVVIRGGIAGLATGLNMVVTDPYGSTWAPFSCSDAGSAGYRLPQAGFYSLSVTASPCEPLYAGPYSITLLNSSGPIVSPADPDGGTVVSGQTVDLGSFPDALLVGDLDAYQFYGEAGDRVVVMADLVGPSSHRISLYRPGSSAQAGTPLFAGCDGRHEAELDVTGTYMLVMEACETDGTGGYAFTMQRLPGPYSHWDATTPPPTDPDGGLIGSPTGEAIDAEISPADVDTYFFYTTGTETVTLEVLNFPGGLMGLSVYPVHPASPSRTGPAIFQQCVGNYTPQQVTLSGSPEGFYAVVLDDCSGSLSGPVPYRLVVTTPNTEVPVDGPLPGVGDSLGNPYTGLSWDPASASNGYVVYFGEVGSPLVALNPGSPVAQPGSGRAGYAMPLSLMTSGRLYAWRVMSLHPVKGQVFSPVWWFAYDCVPAVDVSPAAVAFGNVRAGTTSAPRTLTITNTGTCTLDPRVAGISGSFSLVSDTCTPAPAGGHLAPSASCAVQLDFSPTVVGPYAGALTLDGLLPEAHSGVVDLSGYGVLADLRVSAVSSPPAAPVGGYYVNVNETTQNIGSGPAGASEVGYRFSLDQTIDGADPLGVTAFGSSTPVVHPVPALLAGASSAGGATVYVPSDLPGGSYYVAACADPFDLLPEDNETNNCRPSTGTVLVTRDLRVQEVLDPPQPAPDGTVDATDTTRNIGTLTLPASVTGFRLSLDQKVTRLDRPFAETRTVPLLPPNPAAGHLSTATTTLSIPAETAQGSYFIGACADDTDLFAESSEVNNCELSKTAIIVQPDLSVTAVSNPPITGSAGMEFTVSDTVHNEGLAAAALSVTSYRLSLDTTITATDPLLAGSRTVPELPVGDSSADTATVSIPASVPQGEFYLAACADGPGRIPEQDETNNCRVSATTISVLRADLLVTAVGNPPATGTAGTTFSVTDTTRNDGEAGAAASFTSYRLSTDTTVTAADPQLDGGRDVPALAPLGGVSTGSAGLTVPAAIPPGTYYLAACADGKNAVPETAESNNCRVSATTIVIRVPDLQVSAVSDPPASGGVGTTFVVTDTTVNASATVPAVASVTRYRLSQDTTVSSADVLLTGTRDVAALAAGGSSSGAATVTVPPNIAPGTYYLAACADDARAVAETDEDNNCRVSAGTMSLMKADLAVTAVGNPPASGLVGDSFTISDTTANNGVYTAAASTTKYRLSTDATITSGDPLLTGGRSVPALAPGASSSGGALVTIPESVPAGTFYLGACADDARAVSESDENNNCRASATQIVVRKPDLVVESITDPPVEADFGLSFAVTDLTRNIGPVAAGASTTRYRLSLDQTISAADPLLTGERAVPALAAGASSGGTATVTVPDTIAQGSYYVAACADDGRVVSEESEANNCAVSVTTIDVLNSDLRVVAVSNPPALVFVDSSFDVTDTTENRGVTVAAASTTRYRLSLDRTVTSADPLLTGERAVGTLAAGATSSGTATVVVPGTVAPGTYYLAACADDPRAVTESNETNNCDVSATTVELRKPDLSVTAVTNPPATGVVGASFNVTDTTANGGSAAAGASTTKYRLSLDQTVTTGDPLLTGERDVPALGLGASSAGTVTVTIPGTVAQGMYYLAACADDGRAVSESDENNNCRVSATRIDLRKPDLTVTAVTNPPATGVVGASFNVTDTTVNAGIAAAGASTTQYRLSLDQAVTSADPLLTGTRDVPALGVGASSAGTATVTIPGTIAQGTYYLAACADDGRAVAESDENNNCRVSATTIDLRKPDLTVTAVTNPPATGTVGASFNVTDTTANGGIAAAGASTTKYRLSLDQTVTSADPVLTGTRDVPALGVGASSAGTATVTIPGTVAQGTYYLAACADDGRAVSESDENNNCRVSATTIDLAKADLTVTAVTDPPPVLAAGETFAVTDTTRNVGVADAVASTTAYRLSVDATITSSDTLLAVVGAPRAVPALGPGAQDTGAVIARVPDTIGTGTYYLAACADDRRDVSESDENNNCLLAAAQIQILKPDLTVTAVSNPPFEGFVGTTFDVTDTTVNVGLADSGSQGDASTLTRYRLSLDRTITASDPLLTGQREVLALAPGGSSSGTVTVSVPSSVAQGLYYLAACADGGSAVSESDETNNCFVSATTIDLKKADLRVGAVSDPPAVGTVGASFDVTDTTLNDASALADAGASSTRYRLSADTTITGTDTLLTGARAVPALAIGVGDTGTVTVSIPSSVAQGTFYLAACADEGKAVSESDENNNCAVSSGTIQIRKADLRVGAVSDPPAVGTVGASFDVTDTTLNDPAALAGAETSSTRYRLSADTVITAADPLLTGARPVPALAVGQGDTGTATVTIPSSVPHGTFYLAACADEGRAVSESDENNNCTVSSGTIEIRKADLRVTAVSNPPAVGTVDASFDVTDTTLNDPGAQDDAGASSTRYRLSLDTTITAADPLLTGERAVPALLVGQSDAGTVTVTIPAATPQGIFYLAACADEGRVVSESDENNNCAVSATQIEVRKPDLTVTAVSDPPAEGDPGDSFDVTDTTFNGGLDAAGDSSTRYRLSLDATITAADRLLTGTRAVPALGVGAGSTGTVTVTIPATVPEGHYWLGACADDLRTVPESDDNNNCLASATTINLWKPDLAAASVTTSLAVPWTASAGWGTFNVTDTTDNLSAERAAGASTTRYYLSLDDVLDAGDTQLSGARAVPPVSPSGFSTGTVAVGIPSGVPEGAYWIFACADDDAAVLEADETNNCTRTTMTVDVRWPNLAYHLDLPGDFTLNPGQSFVVWGYVTNGAAGDAGPSTTIFRLSPDTTVSVDDLPLGGGLASPAIPAGGLHSEAATVTVPLGTPPGYYYIAGCADDPGAIVETDETDNCSVYTIGTVQVFGPDLQVTSLSDPPASRLPGQSFTVNDVTGNPAPIGAPASTTSFFLSSDTVRDAGDLQLTGGRAVPAIAAWGSSSGVATTVAIPAGASAGTYYLIGCADGPGAVMETNETNNCRTSSSTIVVQ